MNNAIKHLSAVLILWMLGGCVSTPPHFRAHPDIYERLKDAKELLIAQPELEVYEISAGGGKDKMDDWSEQARQNTAEALQHLAGRRYDSIKLIPGEGLSSDLTSNLEQTIALFRTASAEILLHTYSGGNHRFEEKLSRFDYSVGREVSTLQVLGGKVLLLVLGESYVKSAGRKAVEMTQAVMVAVLTLGRSMPIPKGTITGGTAALIDLKDGAILWYNGAGGEWDLRDQQSAKDWVLKLLEDAPN